MNIGTRMALKSRLKKSKLLIYVYETMLNRINSIVFKSLKIKQIYVDNGLKRRKYGHLNPEKQIYILRGDNPTWGIFTLIFDFLIQIEKYENKGYLFFYDLSKYCVIEEKHGNVNRWDYYFKQVNNLTYSEIYNSAYVLEGWKNGSIISVCRNIPNWNSIDFLQSELRERFSKLYNTYITLNDETQGKIDVFCRSNFQDKRIMGVAIRESYRCRAILKDDIIKGHPCHKTPLEIAHMAKEKMQQWNCEYVFLMSDDYEATLIFEQFFGASCIKYNRNRVHFFENGKPINDDSARNRDIESIYQCTLDYIIETELLARCTSVIGYISSGIEAALLRNNNKYENIQILDQGIY